MKQEDNQIKFRKATKEDLSQIMTLFSNAFIDDPLMLLFNPTQKHHEEFVSALFYVITKAYYHSQLCFVATAGEKIIAASLIKEKNTAELSFMSYARFGGWRLIKSLGMKNFIKFLSIYDEALSACKQLDANLWYLESIAVDKEYQGRRIGTKMIQELILPYIDKHGGGMFTLITQKEKNRLFYQANGFTQFSNQVLENDGYKVDNYNFSLNVKGKKD